MKQNYPNPFNSQTNIEFDIKTKNQYKLELINSLGQMADILIDKELKPGSYKYTFNADEFPSGVYYYRLSSKDFIETNKLILIK